MAEKKRQKNPYPLGAQPEADGVRFSLVSRDPDCGILLYDVLSGKRVKKIPFSEEDRTGNVYCTTVEGIAPETVCYQFYRGRETVPDERGRRFTGRRCFCRRITTGRGIAAPGFPIVTHCFTACM